MKTNLNRLNDYDDDDSDDSDDDYDKEILQESVGELREEPEIGASFTARDVVEFLGRTGTMSGDIQRMNLQLKRCVKLGFLIKNDDGSYSFAEPGIDTEIMVGDRVAFGRRMEDVSCIGRRK